MAYNKQEIAALLTPWTPETLAAAWIVWLRDPTHLQGKGLLVESHDDNGPHFCCLGGLCEMVGIPRSPTSGIHEGYDGSAGLLPGWLAAFMGMEDTVGSRDRGIDLVTMNDNGVPFPKIADAIATGAFCKI